MIGIGNADHRAACGFCLLDRNLHCRHAGDLAEAVACVEQAACRRFADEPHLRIDLHDAGTDTIQIGTQPRDAMRRNAAQIGVNKRIGDGCRRLRAHTGSFEDVFGEASQRFSLKDDMI